MKKIYYIIIGVLGCIVLGTFILTSCSTKISKDQAKEIALNDSKVTESQMTDITIHDDVEKNEKVYDIQFHTKEKEYSYKISKDSGNIVQSKESNLNTTSYSNSLSKHATITEEEAKQIAFKHAKASPEDVQLFECEKAVENGVHVYSIEFYLKNNEYDYDISCKDGAILKHTIKTEPVPSSQFKISINKAEKSALSRVPGATKQDIHISSEFHKDLPVYDGTIRFKGIEYEFKMDAITGNFIEWSKEIDD